MIGIDHQHPRIVACGGERNVQGHDALVPAVTRADHRHNGRNIGGGAPAKCFAHVAHRVEEGCEREGGPQRRPAKPRQVGNAAGSENAAERADHVGFLQARNAGFLGRKRCRLVFRRLRRRRRRCGFGRGRSCDRIDRQQFDGGKPHRSRQRAEHQSDRRDQARGWRERAPLRYRGFADDTRVRRIEALLFLGFARALEERLIHVAACLDVAFEFTKPHRSLAQLHALPLLRLQGSGERGFVVTGPREIVFRRLRVAINLFVHRAVQVFHLLAHLPERRMQRPKFARHFGEAPARLGILRAQVGKRR